MISRQRKAQLYLKITRPSLEPTQPPVPHLFPGGVKRPGRETDNLALSSVEVKAGESDMSTSPVCIHYLYRNKFTLSHCIFKRCIFAVQSVYVCRKGPTMNSNYTTKQH